MAYTPYTPLYQPYSYVPMPQYQPQMQQPQIPQSSSITWVRNAQDAAMYPVAPNNAVALWDQSAAVVYLKQADASGKPSMKTYDLVERAESRSDAPEAKEGKDTAYATKDELGVVVSAVKDFNKVVNDIQSDVDAIKSKVYGKRKEKASDDE